MLASQNFYYPILLSRPNFDIFNYILYTSVGMDTNGRKNRSGMNYENKIQNLLTKYCSSHNIKYSLHFDGIFKKEYENDYSEIKRQITKIKKVPDFIIFGKKNIYLVETNYSDGGSKLQETIKSYIELQREVNNTANIKFIYITDGLQRTKNTSHLETAWKEIDYIVNYNLLQENILDDIIIDR